MMPYIDVSPDRNWSVFLFLPLSRFPPAQCLPLADAGHCTGVCWQLRWGVFRCQRLVSFFPLITPGELSSTLSLSCFSSSLIFPLSLFLCEHPEKCLILSHGSGWAYMPARLIYPQASSHGIFFFFYRSFEQWKGNHLNCNARITREFACSLGCGQGNYLTWVNDFCFDLLERSLSPGLERGWLLMQDPGGKIEAKEAKEGDSVV